MANVVGRRIIETAEAPILDAPLRYAAFLHYYYQTDFLWHCMLFKILKIIVKEY